MSAELFDHVQCELARRKGVRYVASAGCFAGHIFCGDCGSVYGAKVWHSNSKYRKTVWRCNGKYEKADKPCSTPHFYEEQLKEMFVAVMNTRLSDKAAIIAAYKEVVTTLTDNTALEKESQALLEESDIVIELMRKMVQENTHLEQDQTDYQRRYSTLVERFDKAKARLDEMAETIRKRNTKRIELEKFIRMLKKQDGLLTEFDEELWYAVVDRLVVKSDTEVVYVFKDGSETVWKIG